jgi:hypothetical protein
MIQKIIDKLSTNLSQVLECVINSLLNPKGKAQIITTYALYMQKEKWEDQCNNQCRTSTSTYSTYLSLKNNAQLVQVTSSSNCYNRMLLVLLFLLLHTHKHKQRESQSTFVLVITHHHYYWYTYFTVWLHGI